MTDAVEVEEEEAEAPPEKEEEDEGPQQIDVFARWTSLVRKFWFFEGRAGGNLQRAVVSFFLL